MYIYNTILCIILPLHQITKKLVNGNVRVFLIQRLWEWGKFYIVLSFDCRYHVAFFFKFFFDSCENTGVFIVEFFFCCLSKCEWKKYICGSLPFIALEVCPTMTSAAEKLEMWKRSTALSFVALFKNCILNIFIMTHKWSAP